MKATELRIGNYVNYDGNAIVLSIEDDSIEYDSFKSNGYVGLGLIKPIPLTEEWLLKFGFEMYDYDLDDEELYQSFKIPYKKYEYRVTINPDMECEFGVKWRWSEEGVLARIKYVHQLQNLYFALTQNELILNK